MSILNTIKSKLKEYHRVLKVTKKPDRDEFFMSAKITGLGIIAVGLIGFVFYAVATLTIN
ncbi:MAG: protein translocase SEC61 complex subunit gamma [Candidatus Nanohaloarchaeota archaeon QJJ-5]|nr:protein translocase SEC61 complex subunit gamma [Candidatus Nanohaloarchaeota archaeon QJJ-5]